MLHLSLKSVFACGVAAALSAAPAAASIIQNFDEDPVGERPPGLAFVALNAASGSSVTVVDVDSSPADPFGGESNRSMLIHDAASGSSVSAVFQSPDELGKGSLSLTFQTSPTARLFIILGQRDGAGVVGASARALTLYINTGASITNGGGAGAGPALDSLITEADTPYQVDIQFDTQVGVWSGTINGVAITSGGGASIALNNDLTGVNTLQFTTTSTQTGDSFIDDIRLVPEPGSFGLLSLGALLMARRNRRPTARRCV